MTTCNNNNDKMMILFAPFDYISKTLKTKRAWFVLRTEEAMLMSLAHAPMLSPTAMGKEASFSVVSMSAAT